MSDSVPGLRPGEVRRSRARQRRRQRSAERHPNVLTAREFGRGLRSSGRTGGQNFREAARKRLAAEGVSATDLDARVQAAVQERRGQRKQIRESGVGKGAQAMAMRRLQAQDVNYLRRSGGTGLPTIRVRSRDEVMDYRNPAKRAAKRRRSRRARQGSGLNYRNDLPPQIR